MISRAGALGWSLAFLSGGYVLSILAFQLLPPADPGGALRLVLLQSLILVLVFGALTGAVSRILRLSPRDFGAAPVRRGLAGFGWGLLVGTTLAAAAMAIAVLIGRAEWRDDGGSVTSWITTAGLTGLVLLPAAFAEELMFRGVPMIALSRTFGRTPAIVALSVLFGLGHLLNPEVTALAIANIVLAGVFLGLAFFAPGGLWTATGAHLGWNLGLAALAAPVSGWPLPMPWLDYITQEPEWLTGGGFGPEGGVLAALCLLGGAAIVSRRIPREASA